MRAAFDACCGDGSVLTTHTTQCKDWRDRDDTTVPMDACHVRGNVCDASGALSFVGFAEFNMTCDLGALVVALAPVLGSVTRFDVSANPSLTTGRADVSAWPTPRGHRLERSRRFAARRRQRHTPAPRGERFVRQVRVDAVGGREHVHVGGVLGVPRPRLDWLRSKRAQSG